MAKFVELNPRLLESFLVGCGFSRRVKGSEVVYVIANKHFPDVWVKVYTSIRADSVRARGKGQDAIRVTVAYESEIPFKGRTNFGIYKTPKILRTSSTEAICERLYPRMREAYAESNAWLQKNWEIIRESKKLLEKLAQERKNNGAPK
jgi:hypothetical protein